MFSLQITRPLNKNTINQRKEIFRAAETGCGNKPVFGILLIYHLTEDKAKYFILNQPKPVSF